MNVIRVDVIGSEEERKRFYESLLYKEVQSIIEAIKPKDYLFSFSARQFEWDCYGFQTPKGFAQIVLRLDTQHNPKGTVVVGGLRLANMNEEQWKHYMETEGGAWVH
jgi:hypothetical protein